MNKPKDTTAPEAAPQQAVGVDALAMPDIAIGAKLLFPDPRPGVRGARMPDLILSVKAISGAFVFGSGGLKYNFQTVFFEGEKQWAVPYDRALRLKMA